MTTKKTTVKKIEKLRRERRERKERKVEFSIRDRFLLRIQKKIEVLVLPYLSARTKYIEVSVIDGTFECHKIIANKYWHRGYCCKNKKTVFSIPSTIWGVREELRVVDGIVNTKIHKIKKVGNIDLYYVDAIQKCEIKKLWIAKKEKESYHSDTIRGAIKGLLRKLKKTNIKINSDSLISKSDYIRITGACKIGVDNFISSHADFFAKNKKMKVSQLIPFLEKNKAWGVDLLKKSIKR